MPTDLSLSLMTAQWLTDLQSAPTVAVSRALAGLVDFGRYQRADIDDAIVTILRGLEDAAPFQDSLALGIWDWLNERRGISAAGRETYGLDAFIREVREALIIAQRLDLISVTKNILADFWRWENWSIKLQLGHSSRDVRLQLLKLCAVQQQVLNDSILEPRWIQLCRDAGTVVPIAYLDVALLGLRALPRMPGDDLAPRVAFALGLWAATYRPAKDEFIERWSSLRQLMPRADTLWRTIVEDAIGSVCRYTSLQDPISPRAQAENGQIFHAASWWRGTVNAQRKTARTRLHTQSGPPRHGRTLFLSPMPEEARDLATLADEGFTEKVVEMTHDLFDRHEQWARQYGNCYYYHRALTWISPVFLRSHFRRATEILMYYVRRALMWDEQNPSLWNVWQRCLSKLGKPEAAENVAWETVRRFPGNAQARTWLAQQLIDANRSHEAEALLREINFSRSKEPAYTIVLAKIVATKKERYPEALEIVLAGIRNNPTNPRLLIFGAALFLSLNDNGMASKLLDQAEGLKISGHYYSVRFRLAFRQNGRDEARRWLDLGLRQFPNNADLLKKQKLLEGESDEPEQDYDPLSDVDIRLPNELGGSFEEENTHVSGIERVENEIAPASGDEAVQPQLEKSVRHTEENGVNLTPSPKPLTDSPSKNMSSAASLSTSSATQQMRQQPSPKMTKTNPQLDYALHEVLRHGRAKRADFALNGAGLTGAARRSEQAALEKLAKSDPEFLYGQIVLRRRVTMTDRSDIKGVGIPPAVQIEFAFRSGDASALRRMTVAGVEGLLADLGGALSGDKEARERWERGVPRVSGHQGYASYVLQHLLADLGTDDISREDRLRFRMLWNEPITEISKLSHYFFQAIDASLQFNVADNSSR